MSFIDPEQDNSYITFWSQYPDPPDKAETLNAPSWLDISKDQIDDDIIEDDSSEEEEEANDNELEKDINNSPDMIDDDPINLHYVSKPRYVEERLEGLKVMYIKDL